MKSKGGSKHIENHKNKIGARKSMIYFLQYYLLRMFLFKPVLATTGYHSDKHLQIRIEVKQICCRVSLYLWEDDAVPCVNLLLYFHWMSKTPCLFHLFSFITGNMHQLVIRHQLRWKKSKTITFPWTKMEWVPSCFLNTHEHITPIFP